MDALMLSGIEQRDDVGVLQFGDDARLAGELLGLAGESVQRLDRDLAVELAVLRQIDSPLAALAEFPEDFKTADGLCCHGCISCGRARGDEACLSGGGVCR